MHEEQFGESEGRHEDPSGSPRSEAVVEAEEMLKSVARFAHEKPRLALGIALATGYVLGGGLTPRLLVSLVLVAARTQLRQWAVERVHDIAREQFDGMTA